MANNRKKSSRTEDPTKDLVAVAFAAELEQARQYKRLLKENDIRAVVKQSRRTPDARSFAVMVPEEVLDEAHVIIESQHAYEDFYEYACEDEHLASPDDFPEDDFL